jgi:hypothetical protein
MTTQIALEYIPRRMKELGYDSNYHIRFRHIVLKQDGCIEINAQNQLYILVEDVDQVNILSDFGVYDLTQNTDTNEQFYEHQGIIFIGNYSAQTQHLKFIQVIPSHPLCQKT